MVRLFGDGARWLLHCSLVAILVACLVLEFLRRLEAVPGILLVGVCVALGVGAAYAYARVRSARTLLSLLSPVTIVFPTLFVFNPMVFRLLYPSEGVVVSHDVEATTPVVIVVFVVFYGLAWVFKLVMIAILHAVEPDWVRFYGLAVDVAVFLASAVGTALIAVAVAVSYHDLRVVKEGTDIDQIAAVFD